MEFYEREKFKEEQRERSKCKPALLTARKGLLQTRQIKSYTDGIRIGDQDQPLPLRVFPRPVC
jgi:hypothetical protein